MYYKKLLEKYIAHVVNSEGIDFLSCAYVDDDTFTDDEMKMLEELSGLWT